MSWKISKKLVENENNSRWMILIIIYGPYFNDIKMEFEEEYLKDVRNSDYIEDIKYEIRSATKHHQTLIEALDEYIYS